MGRENIMEDVHSIEEEGQGTSPEVQWGGVGGNPPKNAFCDSGSPEIKKPFKIHIMGRAWSCLCIGQGLGTESKSPTQMAGIQLLEPPHVASQGTSEQEARTGSEARTLI